MAELQPQAGTAVNAVPTEKQYRRLLTLGSGWAGVGWSAPLILPLLGRVWIEPDNGSDGLVRVTPAGLRALAAAVERYGLPELDAVRLTRLGRRQTP